MFIVYRMRKKDEGSYSLDEPRHSFAYTRAKDQEFFAWRMDWSMYATVQYTGYRFLCQLNISGNILQL